MGYGGFIKTVVRIAVPAVVSMIPGMQPLGVALASAAATGATGGSFKDALMAGATSYIGSNIARSLSGTQAAVSGAPPSLPIGDGATGTYFPSLEGTAGTGAFSSAPFTDPVGLSATDMAIGSALNKSDEALQPLVSKFTPEGLDQTFGGIKKGLDTTFRGAGDVLNKFGDVVLNKPNLSSNLISGTLSPGPTASLIGGATSFTLNQALLANTPEADQLLADQGYTPIQIQYLKQEARNRLSQGAFEALQGSVTNPGLAQEEFNKILASGIERENLALGPEVTQQQFDTVFDNPNLGQNILGEEEGLRRESFGQDISSAFPGDAFQSLDDNIIDSIVQERQGPAQEKISRFSARGNLNPTGGRTANQFIQSQVPQAQERVRQVGEGVLGGYQSNVQDVQDRAKQQASGYKLGDELFDVTPFSAERSGLVEQQQGQLGSDVRGALGSEPLFDVSGALQSAGRAQGVVSGQGQNQSFLDSIAARELGSTSSRNRRGLRSRGSGAF
jgi:hypothetical protein